MLSNLRPTKHECVHAAIRVATSISHVTKMAETQFERFGRSCIAENPRYTLTSWLSVLYKRSYGRSKFYIAGMRIFDLSCSCDLDLDPMTFYTNLTCFAWTDVWKRTSYVKSSYHSLLVYDVVERKTSTCVVVENKYYIRRVDVKTAASSWEKYEKSRRTLIKILAIYLQQ